MFCNGDRLDKARMIEFALIFPVREDALAFGAVLLDQGHRVQLSKYEKENESMWQIMVTPVMLPNHGEISRLEDLLGRQAAVFRGRNDGWGCYEVRGE
jgi:regulator of ribonuclease activity B